MTNYLCENSHKIFFSIFKYYIICPKNFNLAARRAKMQRLGKISCLRKIPGTKYDFASWGSRWSQKYAKCTNLGTDLVSALAGLQVDDFPHDVCAVVRVSSGRGAESKVRESWRRASEVTGGCFAERGLSAAAAADDDGGGSRWRGAHPPPPPPPCTEDAPLPPCARAPSRCVCVCVLLHICAP